MDANDHLKQMIGDLMIQMAILRAEVEALKMPKPPTPPGELAVVPLSELTTGR